MQLTKLEISGFKSFAKKTELIFKNGITGILGPNGCGKSNIADAFRFVLGEQNAASTKPLHVCAIFASFSVTQASARTDIPSSDRAA